MTIGYYEHWHNEVVRELFPRSSLGTVWRGTFDVVGVIDGLGQLHDGRLVLLEHKTTSDSVEPDSDYWVRLRYNNQICQYVLAARSLGWDVEQILYCVARKPTIR